MEDSKLTVAYWPVQGVSHPIRLLLSYFKVPFEDKFYTGKEDWFMGDKLKLKSPMPNLPYIKDGDIILTESLACLQYAALKTGQRDLLGKNDLDSIRIFQVWGIARELQLTIGQLAWNRDHEKDKPTVLKDKIEPLLAKLSKGLGDQEYFLEYLTWPDFIVAYLVDLVSRLKEESVTALPNLVKHHERIYSNEGIQTYRKSEKYPKCFTVHLATWEGPEKM